jgi:MSHA biogenesis protein MshP
MYLNKIPINNFNRQAGLGLPSAIFLIVVMTLIVASLNQLNELNAQAYGREWLSQRAFYAAESGAQAAAVFMLNSSEAEPVCDASFINNVSLAAAGFSSCNINVACDSQTISSETYITLTSTGSCGTGADQATRIVQVRLLDD